MYIRVKASCRGTVPRSRRGKPCSDRPIPDSDCLTLLYALDFGKAVIPKEMNTPGQVKWTGLSSAQR